MRARAATRLILSAGLTLLGAAEGAPLSADPAEPYIAAATATADDNFKGILSLCVPRNDGEDFLAPPPDPVKVFDNLYFLGISWVSAWALTTSAGIIVIDSLDNPQEAQAYIENGLRKLKLDPNQIKYVIVTHAHGDHAGGAMYLAEKFHAGIVMSQADWDAIAPSAGNGKRAAMPRGSKMVTDGDKLTLGDTTIEFVATPPHTPGTLSLILPLKDGAFTHTGAEWGGTAFNFAPTVENFSAYIASAQKFARIARDRGADVPLSNHASYDEAFRKIAELKQRKPGDPHPFVMGVGSAEQYLAVAAECAMAVRERLRAAGGG